MCPSAPEDTRPLPLTLLKRDFVLRVTAEALTLLLLPLKLSKKSCFAPEVERIRREAARRESAAKRCYSLCFLFFTSSPPSSSSSSPTCHPFLPAQLFLTPLFFLAVNYPTVTDIPETSQSLFGFLRLFCVAAVQ